MPEAVTRLPRAYTLGRSFASSCQSLHPSDPLPDPFLGPLVPTPQQKPRNITTPASVAVIVGGLGMLFCGAIQGAGAMIGLSGGGDLTLTDGTVLRPDAALLTLQAVMSGTDFLVSAFLVIAGLGAMGFRRWARPLGLAAAVAMLTVGVVRIVVTVAWAQPKAIETARGVARAAETATAKMAAATRAAAATRPAGTPEPATQTAGDANIGEMAEATRPVTLAISVVAFLAQAVASGLILSQWAKPEAVEAFNAGWPPADG